MSKIARTTEWRNVKGKTKKARAKNMQQSMASIFKPVIRAAAVPNALPVQEEEEDEEVEIEEISRSHDLSPDLEVTGNIHIFYVHTQTNQSSY